ncbi:glycosyl hydrolase family 18 protein [Clostridiaceae bacterium 35-E11]
MYKRGLLLIIAILIGGMMILPAEAQEGEHIEIQKDEDVYAGITKGEFISTLVEMMGWNSQGQVQDMEEYIYLANQHGLGLNPEEDFNGDISKQDATYILIRSMGYDPLEKEINLLHSPFDDLVIDSSKPAQTIIMEMYEKLIAPIEGLHGFYAIKSYAQRDFIPQLDGVNFGWSRLEFNDESNKIDLKVDEKNHFHIPEKFSEVTEKAKQNNISKHLMIFASQFTKDEAGIGIVEHIIANNEAQEAIIQQIIEHVNGIEKYGEQAEFDGVVIDFEDIREEVLAEKFNLFLRALKDELDESNKKLYVTVPPRKYYKGYDYKTIGEITDGVILMAHDYYEKNADSIKLSNEMQSFYKIKTPLTPIENIHNKGFDLYHALKDITDEATGIRDKHKIYLQISFDVAQWRGIEEAGEIKIWREQPTYDAVKKRIQNEGSKQDLQMHYDKRFENPYLTYYDAESDIHNILWYEDTRSVLTKINLAKLFGIKNISLWRLGNIPGYDQENEKFMYLDTWQQILKQHHKDAN